MKALKRLQGELKQIGGRWSLVVEGLDDAEGVKLWSLEATGRPVLEVTDALRKAIEDEVRKALEGATEFDAQVFAEAAGKAAKRVVLLRFEKQGGDVHWAPLDPDYKAAKARAGLSTKIGIATGALLAALKAANFTLVKRY